MFECSSCVAREGDAAAQTSKPLLVFVCLCEQVLLRCLWGVLADRFWIQRAIEFARHEAVERTWAERETNVDGTWTERCECGQVVVRQTVGKVGLIIGKELGHGFWTLFPESCPRVGVFIGRAAEVSFRLPSASPFVGKAC